MADKLQVEIVTLSRAVFSGAASEVSVPGYKGELGILPDHRALVTMLEPGLVRIVDSDRPRLFAVSTGFAEIMNNRVTLLVRTCEGADELDAARARAALADAEKKLGSTGDVTPEMADEERARVMRARARLTVIERATGGK